MLAVIGDDLAADSFLWCYRYFIVNMDYVKHLNEESFLMKDGRKISLSRDGRAALKIRYMAYVFKRMEG